MTALESVTPVVRRGLESFWRPDSVAVVGASDNPAKWGHWLASGALEGSDSREVHLVNHRGATVCGVPTLPDIRHLDHEVELAAICVPQAAVIDSVAGALEVGARALLVITDGLVNTLGEDSTAAEIAALARSAGARLIGPSSLGVVDNAARLRLAWGQFTAGPVAVVTQSGQVGSELAHLLSRSGSGVSRFASLGAQLDVEAEEILTELVDDPGTHAVVMYLEQVRDADTFLDAASALRSADKPLIVLAAGSSTAGSAAARSHTGALTAGVDVIDAACRAAGAVRVATPTQAAALAHSLSLGVRPNGRRVAVVSDSGGQAALAADVATEAGLTVQQLDSSAAERVSGLLPHVVRPANPVDLAGAGEQDLSTYAAVPEALRHSADAILLTGYFGRFGEDTPSLLAEEREVASRLTVLAKRVPVAVHTMAENSASTQVLTDGGIPVFTDIEIAAHTLADCTRWHTAYARQLPSRPLPAAEPAYEVPYLNARDVLAKTGVPVAEAGLAESPAQAVQLSRGWAGRTVLKAADIAHKTEGGGGVLGQQDEYELTRAFQELTDRLGGGRIIVERMDERRDVVELLVGVRTDPVFGPVILVGAGGRQAEMWRDTTLELAPVNATQAKAMLTRLRSFPLLLGWRGSAATDLDSLADAIAALSTVPFQEPDITAVEVNPLRAGPDGVLAVDALVTRTSPDIKEISQ